MTSPSQEKGDKAERELVGILRDLGVNAHRIRCEGVNDQGDIGGLTDVTVEVKNYPGNIVRAISDGFVDLAVEQANTRTPFGCVMVRKRGGRWMVAMDLDQWVGLWREAMEPLAKREAS